MGNLSLIIIFVVVCLLGTASILNTTKTIELSSPAATGVESRQFYNRNLQLHFPNLIDQLIMFFTRLFEIFGGSTETTEATTTTTTTTTTTAKLTCALLGGKLCSDIAAPNCITLAASAALFSTWASTCAQTGSGMGVFHTETTPLIPEGPDQDQTEALKCYFDTENLMIGDIIYIGSSTNPAKCKKLKIEPDGKVTVNVKNCAGLNKKFVCSVPVPP